MSIITSQISLTIPSGTPYTFYSSGGSANVFENQGSGYVFIGSVEHRGRIFTFLTGDLIVYANDPDNQVDFSYREGEHIISDTPIDSLKVEAKGWYDITEGTLKTDLVASFGSLSSESLSISDSAQNGLNLGTGDFAISFWIKPTTVSGAAWIYTKAVGGVGFPGVDIYRSGASLIARYGDTTTFVTLSGNNVLAEGSWAHVVMRCDRNGVAELLVNNVSIDTDSTVVVGTLDNTRELSLGAYNSGGSSPYSGDMAHVAVWGRDLSAADISLLYDAGVMQIIPASLETGGVSYWPLWEPRGVRYDRWGANHLTDNNTVGAAHGPVEYDADEYAGVWPTNQGQASNPFGDLAPIAPGDAPQLIGDALVWDGLAKALITPTGDVSQACTKVLVMTPEAFGGNDYVSGSYGAKNLLRLVGSTLNMLTSTSNNVTSLSVSTRYIIIAEFDGSNSRVTVNGTEYAIAAGTGDNPGLTIGGRENGSSVYTGSIEAALEFDRILTSAEISALTTHYE